MIEFNKLYRRFNAYTVKEYCLEEEIMKKAVLFFLIVALCVVLTGCSSRSSSSRSSYSSSSYSGSTSSNKGAGGYDMPNSNDKTFLDYMKRVDPGLYNSLIGD